MLAIFSLGAWGCGTVPPDKPRGVPSTQESTLSKVQINELAGSWAYEEGSASYQVNLDQEGKGEYDWKKGRFRTTSLSNGVWKGTWHQEENDREGGFELQLQSDLQLASGRWWYTRIGKDQEPLEPGGDFTLRRIHSDPGGKEALR